MKGKGKRKEQTNGVEEKRPGDLTSDPDEF